MTRIKSAMLGIVVAGLYAGVAQADPTQWAGNNHWYEAVNVGTAGISWTNARDAAVARGGYLTTITSSQENDYVYSLVTDSSFWFQDPVYHNGQGPWIGAYQTDKLAEPAGHWAWVTGETWSYTNWASGYINGIQSYEPNNSGGHEDYGQLLGFRTPTGKYWNDYPNNSQPNDGGFVKSYIVEWNTNPIPEPTTMALLALGSIVMLGRTRRRSMKS